MVNQPRPWLDRIPAQASEANLLAPLTAGTQRQVGFVEMLSEAPPIVTVEYPIGSGNHVTAPCEVGVYSPAAICNALLDGSGRITFVYAPSKLSEEEEEQIPIGDNAWGKGEVFDPSGLEEAITAAKTELEAAQEQLETELAGLVTTTQQQAEQISKATQDAEEALTAADLASSSAAAASLLANEKSRITAGAKYPAQPTAGDLHWVTNDDGDVVGIHIFDGATWAPYSLNVDSVAAVNSISANKLVASEELWAKIATFAKIRTDQIVAGTAKIAGELLADTIKGKTLEGGMLKVGNGTSQPEMLTGPRSGNTSQIGDRFGVYLDTPNNKNGGASFEVTPTGPSIYMESAPTDNYKSVTSITPEITKFGGQFKNENPVYSLIIRPANPMGAADLQITGEGGKEVSLRQYAEKNGDVIFVNGQSYWASGTFVKTVQANQWDTRSGVHIHQATQTLPVLPPRYVYVLNHVGSSPALWPTVQVAARSANVITYTIRIQRFAVPDFASTFRISWQLIRDSAG